MKKVIFLLMCISFLAGCSGSKPVFPVSLKNEEALSVTADIKAEQDLPVKVKTQDNEALSVSLKPQDPPLAVDVTVQDESGFPVRVQGQSGAEPMTVSISQNSALSVKGQNQESRWFPVEMHITWQAVAAIVVAALAMLAAVAGSIAACLLARGARRTAEARLFFEFIQRYAAKEMRDNLRMLHEWDRKEVGQNKSKRDEQAQKWVKRLFASDDEGLRKEADELDAARRHVTHYFLDVLLLNEAKYISNRLLKKLCTSLGYGGTDVLNITLALEKALIEQIGRRGGKSEREISKDVKKVERKFQKLMAITS